MTRVNWWIDVRIREFLLSPPDRLVSELTDGRYIELNVYDDQEKANQVFKMNNRVALPVVDIQQYSRWNCNH